MTSPKVTAVKVSALSYVGTTWLNLVLGSHEDTLTIGPPHRLWELKDKGFENACLIHGANDTFWTGFHKVWDRKKNFLVALSEYSGKKYFLFDNPHEPFIDEVLTSPEVEVKELRYCRDARAVTASFARKFPDQDYISTIKPTGWFYHSFQGIPSDENLLRVKYEDTVNDLPTTLQKVGDFLGLVYTDKAARFWEFDHHITSGNAGAIATVKLAKGIDIARTPELDFYRQQFEALKADPLQGFRDERWRRQLSRRDLFFFDLYLGKKNAEFGYLRDNFSQPEIRIFLDWHDRQVEQKIQEPLTDLALETAKELQSVSRKRSYKANDPKFPADLDWPVQRENLSSAEKDNIDNHGIFGNLLTPFKVFDKNVKQIWPPLHPSLIETLSSTTKYFDGLPGSKKRRLRKYKAVKGPYNRDHVVKWHVNNNMHLGYGPDYLEKDPAALTVDPLLRYRDLLQRLIQMDHLEFKSYKDVLGDKSGKIRPGNDKSTVLIRHDVDGDLMAAVDMAKLEAEYGIKSTYFILHTAPYYANVRGKKVQRNEGSVEFYKEIEALGHEIALHTDSQTLYQTYNIDGARAIETEIDWLRSHGIKLEGTLAHNSFSVYSANNYCIFKDRPLTGFDMPGDAKSVEFNGKWSALQQLDEAKLGLSYEGNEIFWQDDDPVRYYSLMHQSMWFLTDDMHGTLQHGQTRPVQSSKWISQEEVLEDAETIPPGQFCVIVVHPLHYGLRTQAHENPNATINHALKAIGIETTRESDWVKAAVKPKPNNETSIKTGVVSVQQNERRDARLAYGFVGDHLEFASPFVPNERGINERPDSLFRDAEKQILFLGGRFFAGSTLPTDSRVSQLVTQYLTFRNAASLGYLSSFYFIDEGVQKALTDMNLKDSGFLVVGISEQHLADQVFLDQINEEHKKGRSVLCVFEGEVDSHEDFRTLVEGNAVQKLIKNFEAVLDCPVISPFERFSEYSKSSSGNLMWESCPEWGYQAHSIVADMIANWIVKDLKV